MGTEIVREAGTKGPSVKEVIRAARAKDEVATELVNSSGVNLGMRAAYLINTFKPELTVIGGDISSAGEQFLQPFMNSVKRFRLKSMENKGIPRLSSRPRGSELEGAIGLAAREIFIES